MAKHLRINCEPTLCHPNPMVGARYCIEIFASIKSLLAENLPDSVRMCVNQGYHIVTRSIRTEIGQFWFKSIYNFEYLLTTKLIPWKI